VLERVLAAVASVVLVVVVLSPVLRENPYDDGFPLSSLASPFCRCSPRSGG